MNKLVIDPLVEFHDPTYIRHNARRLEHLASMQLPIHGKTVLEVGAGIGDHTSFYLDRGCSVLATDARPENLAVLNRIHGANALTCLLNLDDVEGLVESGGNHPLKQIVHAYGILYHLSYPAQALAYLARCCSEFMVLETCVSYGAEPKVNVVGENKDQPSQSFTGQGCRPTRSWVQDELQKHFKFVYVAAKQPNCWDFPLDWTKPTGAVLTRAVFVAAHIQLDFAEHSLQVLLPDVQERAP